MSTQGSFMSRFRPSTIIASVISVIILVAGLYPYPEVSKDLIIFIGRFHPLVVHMPIGFITAVLILQVVALFSKGDLRPGIAVLLWFTALTAVLSAIIGTLLAIPGGYDEALLDQHRWLGLGTSVACIWMLVAHQARSRGGTIAYGVVLLACMGAVGATGHLGGALTHGEDYLTAYLPEALGGEAKPEPVDPGTKEDAAVFGRVIEPILQGKCVDCHNPSKSTGGLLMHDLPSLLSGGIHGPAIVPNNAGESLMIQRALLPLDHKEHMPPKGRVQLSEAELDTIRWWINQGAPERMPLGDDLPSDAAIAFMEKELGFPFAPPKLEMLPWDEVVQLSASLHESPGLRVRRVAQDSPALDVFLEPDTNSVDELVAQLEPIKANITLLDLGQTTFTEATLERIGTFLNLEQLRLHETPVTDEGIRHLQNLRKLAKLNLYGTAITDAGLDALRKLPSLRQVNTWGTQVSYEAAEDFMASMIDMEKQKKLQQMIQDFQSELQSMGVEVVGVDRKVVEPPKAFEDNGEKYGQLITKLARVTVSSTSEYDPAGGLKALVEKDGEDLAFAFHTLEEKNPWVKFSYRHPVNLNAIRVMNRADLPERAEGLVLESSNKGSADAILGLVADTERKLIQYRLATSLKGRYVVMRITGPGTCNPGAAELLLGYGRGGSYRDKVLDLKPIAYYSFDPADLADGDTVGNLGSLTNTASLSGGATFTGTSGGLVGGGLSIDNDSRQMLAVDGSPIDLNEAWTISAWFQGLHDTSSYRTLTRAEGDGQDHQVIVNKGSSDLGLWNNAPTDALPNGFRDSGHDLPSGESTWHHIAAVGIGGDAGQTDFYIDGVLVGTADQGSSGNIYAIGNFQGGGQPFAQVIDEFAVFDSALRPDQIASLASLDASPAEKAETSILPAPVKATASSEFDQRFLAGNLFDGGASMADIGTNARVGAEYAGKGPGPHIVVYDMGKPVTFNRVFYAQRRNPCDHAKTIEFWVSDTDPGAAAITLPILEGTGWQEVHKFDGKKTSWDVDLTAVPAGKRRARDFRLILPQDKAFLHLKKVLMWGEELPLMGSIETFDGDATKYGERINSRARVTVSSSSQYDPADGLAKLVQDEDNGLSFAFHTQNEENPWVQFSYDKPTLLNAISIINREDGNQERAAGLRLESSNDGKDWQIAWTSEAVEEQWHVDLTGIPDGKRKARHFRLVIPSSATLHLAQVGLWGKPDTSGDRSDPVARFDGEGKKYGERINTRAKVSLSSVWGGSPGTADLPKLVQDEDNGMEFAFHTTSEKNPWVQFSYDSPVTLGALVIRNRGNIQERADGLTLQILRPGRDWEPIWKAPGVQSVWEVDLTAIPAEERRASAFRLILDQEAPQYFHLGQVRIWGTQEGEAPRVEPDAAPGTTGQGAWIYRTVSNWGKVPGHDHIGSTHGGVVVDSSGRVYVSTDGPHGIIVYENDGTFVRSLGGHTQRFHGLDLNREDGKDYIYAAGMQRVCKMDLEGNIILTLEGPNHPEEHNWTKATAVAVAPNGDFFVADGYATSVIFKYDKSGKFVGKFGARGRENGQFITSHGLAVDDRDPEHPVLIVCDRENHRLQLFDLDGNFLRVAATDLRRPCSLSIHNGHMLVAELAGRAVLLDRDYQILSKLGDNPDESQRANFNVPPEQWKEAVFTAPHGCSFDQQGNIYIQDWNKWGRITKLVLNGPVAE